MEHPSFTLTHNTIHVGTNQSDMTT